MQDSVGWGPGQHTLRTAVRAACPASRKAPAPTPLPPTARPLPRPCSRGSPSRAALPWPRQVQPPGLWSVSALLAWPPHQAIVQPPCSSGPSHPALLSLTIRSSSARPAPKSCPHTPASWKRLPFCRCLQRLCAVVSCHGSLVPHGSPRSLPYSPGFPSKPKLQSPGQLGCWPRPETFVVVTAE